MSSASVVVFIALWGRGEPLVEDFWYVCGAWQRLGLEGEGACPSGGVSEIGDDGLFSLTLVVTFLKKPFEFGYMVFQRLPQLPSLFHLFAHLFAT